MTEQQQTLSQRGACWETPGPLGRRPSQPRGKKSTAERRMGAGLRGSGGEEPVGVRGACLAVFKCCFSSVFLRSAFLCLSTRGPHRLQTGFHRTPRLNERGVRRPRRSAEAPAGAQSVMTSRGAGRVSAQTFPICPLLSRLPDPRGSRSTAAQCVPREGRKAANEGGGARLLGLK